MTDEQLRQLGRNATDGDPESRRRLVNERLRAGHALDFSDETLWNFATSRKYIESLWRYDRELEGPFDDEAARLNHVLLQIFDDNVLHSAVSAGGGLTFARHPKKEDDTYSGFCGLEMGHASRMRIIRKVPASHARDAEGNRIWAIELRRTIDGLYFTQYMENEQSPIVLAANDILGHFWTEESTYTYSATEIILSLEDEIHKRTRHISKSKRYTDNSRLNQ